MGAGMYRRFRSDRFTEVSVMTRPQVYGLADRHGALWAEVWPVNSGRPPADVRLIPCEVPAPTDPDDMRDALTRIFPPEEYHVDTLHAHVDRLEVFTDHDRKDLIS